MWVAIHHRQRENPEARRCRVRARPEAAPTRPHPLPERLSSRDALCRAMPAQPCRRVGSERRHLRDCSKVDRMTPADLSISRCGSPEHQSDLERLAAAGIAVPHEYASWCLHDSTAAWYWCRADHERWAHPAVFAVKVERSRALPGTRIGQVPRVGRALHEPTLAQLGTLLASASRRIPRLQRLDVQVFDEESQRRQRTEHSILAAGGLEHGSSRSYARTLVIPLPSSEDHALLASLRPGARRRISKFQRDAPAEIRPITGDAYLHRLHALHAEAFARTGTHPPALRFADVIRDAGFGRSILLGTFLHGRPAPDDLVAFLWCRLHGDHVTYDTAGSEKSEAVQGIPVAYPLLWEMLRWGAGNGARWADLGGVLPAGAVPGHPAAGISEFKRRFSEREQVVASEYRFEPRPIITRSAEAVRQFAHRVRGIVRSARPSPARRRG
jgi:hypothetical protein